MVSKTTLIFYLKIMQSLAPSFSFLIIVLTILQNTKNIIKKKKNKYATQLSEMLISLSQKDFDVIFP